MKTEDLEKIYKLGRKHWADDAWLTKKYLKSSFEQDGLSYVAKEDNKVVGGIIMVYEDIVKNWIRYLIIDKEFRGRGIGTQLMHQVTHHIKHGESIFVDTGVSDKGAIKFYEKCGFKNRGYIKSLYKDRPAYILEKNI